LYKPIIVFIEIIILQNSTQLNSTQQ